jgi:hypothetical protein
MARLRPGSHWSRLRRDCKPSWRVRAKFSAALGLQGGFTVKPFREDMVGDVHQLLLVLLGAVSLVC